MGQDVLPSFGDLLRRHRQRARLTQEELAERSGLSARGIAYLERGKRTYPHRDTVALLSEALKLPAEEREVFAAAARGPTSGPSRAADSASLPLQPTPFIGREVQLGAVSRMLLRPDVRLLTLTGAGGIGKTRLALEVAARSLQSFPDGVYFVSLAAIEDPSLVLPAIAQALGIKEMGSRELVEVIADHLSGRRTLILLDNLEHLLDAAPSVTHLLARAPELKVLATSRSLLRLSWERSFLVPPMSLPQSSGRLDPEGLSQSEAARLFVERARAVAPGLQLDAHNARAVAEICRRLDGLPLAIELAAARSATLTPTAMLGKLTDRLGLLRSGPRDLPARQQTMRAAIDWSYRLLSEGEQRLLRRLAVFAGGWTLEAAEAVCGAGGDQDVLGGTESLLDQSLIQPEEGVGGEPRFGMLETVREYALERLGESGEWDELRKRHAEYYLELAERAARELSSRRRALWLGRLEQEQDNLRAVLSRSLEASDAETPARLGRSLRWFWWVSGYASEARRWMETILRSGCGLSPEARAAATFVAGMAAYSQTDPRGAKPLLEAALDLCDQVGDAEGTVWAVVLLGWIAANLEDHERAVGYLERGLLLSRETRNRYLEGVTLIALGDDRMARANPDGALHLYEEALGLLPADPEISGIRGIVLHLMGEAELYRGDDTSARAYFERSLEFLRSAMQNVWALHPLCGLGLLALEHGDTASAEEYFREGLVLSRRGGVWQGLAQCLEGLGAISGRRGEGRRAARLFAAADALRESTGFSVRLFMRARYLAWLSEARAQVDEDEWSRAWAEGRAMTAEVAAEYALDEAVAPSSSGRALE